MNIEDFRHHCLTKKEVTEEFPFDKQTLVYKVAGKMFALTDIETFESINLKCDPEMGAILRDQYEAVLPGYHMNKKHWITVLTKGGIPDKLILQWIDDSYTLVVATLPKSLQEKLK